MGQWYQVQKIEFYYACPCPVRQLQHYLNIGTIFQSNCIDLVQISPSSLTKLKEGIFMSITLKQARIIAEAGIAKGRELDLKPLSVVILDPRTSLVACNSRKV